MHLAPASRRSLIAVASLFLLASFCVQYARAGDRTPLSGILPQTPLEPSFTSEGQIVPLDTALVECPQTETFADAEGGPSPGTSYDGVLTKSDHALRSRQDPR